MDFPTLLHLHRPRRTPFRMAWCQMRDECHAPQSHFIAVVQHPIDLCGRIKHRRVAAVLEVRPAARFDDRHVGIHDHILCAGKCLDRRAASVVIPVRMTDQQNPYVSEPESQSFYTGPNEGNARLEIAVDENVALRRGDEIIRKAFASDVVETPGDAEWRKWLGPVRTVLRARRAKETVEYE